MAEIFMTIFLLPELLDFIVCASVDDEVKLEGNPKKR
jgi:hypothetical protein